GQSGVLLAGRNASFTANGAAASILVGNAGNSFGGTLAFTGTDLANVTVAASTALTLPAPGISGNLSATGNGIVQSGPLATGGGGNSAGSFAFAARNASLTTSAAAVLAASTLGGALAVTAGGDISQTGALQVTGTSAFAANGGARTITLGQAGNQFGGTITA